MNSDLYFAFLRLLRLGFRRQGMVFKFVFKLQFIFIIADMPSKDFPCLEYHRNAKQKLRSIDVLT